MAWPWRVSINQVVLVENDADAPLIQWVPDPSRRPGSRSAGFTDAGRSTMSFVMGGSVLDVSADTRPLPAESRSDGPKSLKFGNELRSRLYGDHRS